MRIIVLVECDCCSERLDVVVDRKQLKLPLNSEIRSEARRLGWHLGRRCICPECLKRYADCGKCSTCKNWRNKIMETPTCKLDGELALAGDYCDSYGGRESAQ